MKKLGLLGKNIGYSFSRNYFNTKFTQEGIENDFSYENFDLQNINELASILKNNPELLGINVTIPYKELVIPFLDELSEDAAAIGAVNTIKISPIGKLIGYNTDYYGFTRALQPLLQNHHKKALILGTGGAAKAVVFALKKLNIESNYVSREAQENYFSYTQIDASTFKEYHIIINCTPLGTSPQTALFPKIPYQYFTSKHIAFDLIYNPEKTLFLQKAEAKGALIMNGYGMLVFQAEKAWEIWND
jgi:shikimate dehydrogenase